MPIIELLDINHKYHTQHQIFHALKNVSLSIDAGEKIAVIGHSGSGKSTLINIIGLLLTPSSGIYRLYGQNTSLLSEKDKACLIAENFGVVFQNFHLVKRLSVMDNIAFPLVYTNYTKSIKKMLVEQALELIGLEQLRNKKPNELSGGQQQLISFARALVTKPKIIIADEPTSNLDSINENKIMDLLDSINQKGTTVLTIFHNLALASRYNRILCIGDGMVREERT